MTLTRAQRANLRKLADYLESLPEDYEHFDMGSFIDSKGDDDALISYARKNGGVHLCGTTACAVGHGPAAGILFRPSDFEELYGRTLLNWEAYYNRFTPIASFHWAFGDTWESVDNHHWGAAARIRYLLKHGKPPEDFDDEASAEWRKHYREFDKRHAAKVAA